MLVLPVLKETTAPAGGAAPFRVTVPADVLPPTTVLGLRESDVRVAALTVRVVVLVVP
jgi:hypothetical protein